MLLDEVLPNCHFREAHAIEVNASTEAVLRVLRSPRPDDMRLLTVLSSDSRIASAKRASASPPPAASRTLRARCHACS